ncbi:MAG TPA: hypothetical protein VHN98_07770 [Acidimicrobiales bacterium]|nr:hypothetical protein [Acidimicrobiales bacterium]
MIGAAIIVVVLLALPTLFLITGGVLSGVVGWLLKDNADATHEGSELIDLNY